MNAVEALREVERRIVEMVDSRYYCGSQEIGGRDALIHVRAVLTDVLTSSPGQAADQ